MDSTARNEVLLVGRLSQPAQAVDLPSGDQLTSFRVVVDRGPSKRPVPDGRRVPTVDTLECVAWQPHVQKAAQGWEPGDVLEVHGAARRRFYRAGGSVQSRFEIEVSKVKRVAKAA
ncbi:MAG: Single-stranded DNA-binding protein [Frankiales bacterium]|nr:Single-stranded DNA-binding protein [Frankiales bacterium]